MADPELSDDWIAMLVGPGGEERHYRAGGPASALAGLVDLLA